MVADFRGVEACELLVATYEQPSWYVKGLLGPGCYILASKPKVGKSIFILQLGVALVSGQEFLEAFEVCRANACLLELEDGLKRAQQRLWLITDEIPSGLRIVEEAERLDAGLLDQIRADYARHPQTGVYVIDTFAAVRPPDAEYSYQADYGYVKSLADLGTSLGVCVILVHHCRKAVGFGDSFDDISGTNGLTAGATGMIVLAKDHRDSGKVIMSAKGKDIEESAWRIELVDGRWRMVEPMTPHDVARYAVPDCILATASWMGEHGDKWAGTTAELYNAVGIDDVSVNAYGKYLAQHRGFLSDEGVSYKRRHTRNGSVISLIFNEGDGDDSASR